MSDVPGERTSSHGAGTQPPLRQYTFNLQGIYTWSVWSEDLISAFQLLCRLMAEQNMDGGSVMRDGVSDSGSSYTRSLEIRVQIWDPAAAVASGDLY